MDQPADEATKQRAYQFIQHNKVMTISSVSPEGQPHSALVYFIFDQQTMQLFFMTKDTTRKYKNLQTNNKVAVVIGTKDEAATVQIEGTAAVIPDRAQQMDTLKKLLEVANGGSGNWPAVMRLPGTEPPHVFGIKISLIIMYDARSLIEYDPKNQQAYYKIFP